MRQQIKKKKKHSTPKRLTGAESHLRVFRLSSKGGNRTCVGKVRNNLKTQHLNCSRRESNFPLVGRTCGCGRPAGVDSPSWAELMCRRFADDVVLFAWEPSQALGAEEPQGRCSDGRAESGLLQVEPEPFSGSDSIPGLAEGGKRCVNRPQAATPARQSQDSPQSWSGGSPLHPHIIVACLGCSQTPPLVVLSAWPWPSRFIALATAALLPRLFCSVLFIR